MSLLLLLTGRGSGLVGEPVGALAVGRKAPRLKVSFFRPLIGADAPVQIGGRDYSPDVISLQVTTAINCGYQQGQIVWDLQPRSPSPSVARHERHLEQRDDIRHLVHLVVTDNSEIVWEGRISKLYAPGGRMNRADVIGYGNFATKDYPLQWANATATYSSGQILQQAVTTAAPMLHVGAQSGASPRTAAAGIQYVDPGVPHTQADLANTKYLSEVLDQISKEGNLAGDPVWYGVYEDRTLYLLPLVPPAMPDYLIDWSQAVDYQEDGENLYGALVLTYSGGTRSPLTWPAGGTNADWVQEWGLSINGFPRTAHIDGGTLSDARALAYAQTQLGVLSGPAVSCKVTIGGPIGEGELSGIRLATGGTRGPHLVRAGEWVQIGADEDAITLPIVRTTLAVSGTAITNVLELGALYPDERRFLYEARQTARYYALGNNPNTGSSAA